MMEDNFKDINDDIKNIEGRVGIHALIISGRNKIDLQDAFVLVEKGNIIERLQKQEAENQAIRHELKKTREENQEFRESWQNNAKLLRTVLISVLVTCVILISLAAYAVRTYGSENTGRIITGLDGAIEDVR